MSIFLECPLSPPFPPLSPQRRCIIPAIGYFEWQEENGRKQPYFIRPTDQTSFGIAGLWQTFTNSTGLRSGQFTVLTTEAAPSIAAIHQRMPVILLGQVEEDTWLEESYGSADVQDLCEMYPDDQLVSTAVSSSMNSMRTHDWHVLDGLLPE